MPALSYATKPVTAAIVADYIVFSGAAASTAAIATVAGPDRTYYYSCGVRISFGYDWRGAITQAHHTYLEVMPTLRTMLRIQLNGGKVINVYEEQQEPLPQPTSNPT